MDGLKRRYIESVYLEREKQKAEAAKERTQFENQTCLRPDMNSNSVELPVRKISLRFMKRQGEHRVDQAPSRRLEGVDAC